MKKRCEDYKILIGEMIIANDILKNLGGKQRLSAVRELHEKMNMHMSVRACTSS